jgi:4-amino-4-deoxy-L-arabinose transferase-like glycosyltransferase
MARLAPLATSVAAPSAAASLVALVLRARALNDEIDFDPVVYLIVGSNARHGALPYRDLFDHKGPLTYWLYGAIDAPFPGSPTAVRLVLLASFVASIVLLAALVRRNAGPWVAWPTAIVYAVAASSSTFTGQSPNLEQMLLPAMIGAVWAADRHRQAGGVRWALASGVCLGVLIACKPTLGLLGLLCLGLVAWRTRRGGAGAAALIGGAAVVVVAAVAPFVVAGALDDLRDAVLTFNRTYTRSGFDALTGYGVRGLVDFLWWSPSVGFMALALIAGAYGWAVSPENRRLLGIAAAWAFLMYLEAKVQVRDFSYYFVPLLPPLAIAIGVGVTALVGEPGRTRGPARPVVLAAMLLVPLLAHYGLQNAGDRSVSSAARLPSNFESPLVPGGLAVDDLAAGPAAQPPNPPDEQVAAVLRRVTRPREPVYIAGEFATGAYWLADRPPATRWVCPTCYRPQPPYAQIAADLRRTPPAAIVVVAKYRTDYLQAALHARKLRPLFPPNRTPGFQVYIRPGALG